MASYEPTRITRSMSIPSSSSPTLTPHTKMEERKENNMMSHLMGVCRSGNSEELKRLLKNKSPDIILNLRHNDETTPLHEACCHGNVECISILLKQGAEANIYDARGYAPIHCAAYNDHCDAIKTLLDFTPPDINFTSKCKLDQLSEQEETPLHVACLMGNVKTVEFLYKMGASLECVSMEKNTILHFVSASDCADLWGWAESELKSDMPRLVKEENVYRWTPAHLAASLGNTVSISVLLSLQADFNAKDKQGLTPTDFMIHHGNTKCYSIATKQQHPKVIPSRKVKNPGRALCEDGGDGDGGGGGGGSASPALRLSRRTSITGRDRPITMSFNPPSPRSGHTRRPSNLSQKSLASRTPSMDSFLSVNKEFVNKLQVFSRLNSASSEEIIRMAIDTTAYEPPPELLVDADAVLRGTISQEKSTLYYSKHNIKLTMRNTKPQPSPPRTTRKENYSPPTRPQPSLQVMEVCIAATMHYYIPFPQGYTIVSPICFVSCKSERSCLISLSLPHAIDTKIDKKCLNILSFHTYDLVNSSSGGSWGGGSPAPIDSPMERQLCPINVNKLLVEGDVVSFETCIINPSLFAIGIRSDAVDTVPRPLLLPLRCILFCVWQDLSQCATIGTVPVTMYVGLKLPTVTEIMNKEFESTKSKFKPIGFSMKDDRVSLKAELCDDEENRWKLDIAQPQQVLYDEVALKKYTGIHSYSDRFSYPPHRVVSITPSSKIGMVDSYIHLKVSILDAEGDCVDSVHFIPFAPLKSTAATPIPTPPTTLDRRDYRNAPPSSHSAVPMTTPPLHSTIPKTAPPPPRTTPPPHAQSMVPRTTPPPQFVGPRTTPPPQSMVPRTLPQSTVPRTTPPPQSTGPRTTPPPQSVGPRTTPPPQSVAVSKTSPPLPLIPRTTPPLRSTPPGVSASTNRTVISTSYRNGPKLHIADANNTNQNESIV